MAKFEVYSGGYLVQYAPSFDTRNEAEAWVSEVGERGGWDERVEVVFVSLDGHEGNCGKCWEMEVLQRVGEDWLCDSCAFQA